MSTLTIDPRFVPAQLNLMRRPRRQRGLRLAEWLNSWKQTLIAELVALGAGVEKAL